MRWNNMLRAGTTGAIGVGLFVCAGAQATGLSANETAPPTLILPRFTVLLVIVSPFLLLSRIVL